MPLYKIIICCNIAGTEEEHEVEADSWQEAQDYASDLAQETFSPEGWVDSEIEKGEE